MKREFLEVLGLEKETVDKIIAENGADVEREKAKTTQVKAELAEAKEHLEAANADMEKLQKNNGDTAALQKKLDDLQAKYDADIAERDAKLADRDYSDAINKAVFEKIPHGFKGGELAKQGFLAALRAKKLELKDGELIGFDDFLKEQKEANPEAFASDKPAPRIVSSTGNGGAPASPISRAAQIAAQYNENLYGSPNKKE